MHRFVRSKSKNASRSPPGIKLVLALGLPHPVRSADQLKLTLAEQGPSENGTGRCITRSAKRGVLMRFVLIPTLMRVAAAALIVPSSAIAAYSFTTIDVPGADSGSTVAYGINNFGTITGSYMMGKGNYGFVDAGGVFTTINDPLADRTTPSEQAVRPGNERAAGAEPRHAHPPRWRCLSARAGVPISRLRVRRT